MRQRSFVRFTQWVAAGFGLGLAFAAGTAYGSNSKLDEAHAAVTKAISLLKEAEGNGPNFEAHRKKALDLLVRAQGEVVKAKAE